ncbi:uncharacterized protein N7446_011096 [Penicillium canescens]|uniref:Uncharacterized protein n=1 Tax=Penicillium canescens TaxID=5083 RepID=A0AAD6IHC4_PENCN|nr:uncharacterized protein N7446_011096 [Penicillium canescens]KAJ6029553.1 hypothetical protein N7444_012540 [Penicillium canescens]KAJ6047983.1 hypothetical protein N7460_004130 [Penicillium canescens]KAJ6048413.1 hypothetical protein N7446_011096 [Penicillium canescens]
MVRLFNRFYALSAVAACTILPTAWFLTSRRFPDIIPLASGQFQAAPTFDQRLVVFGDSWSDNETNEPQGKVWTDWLCSMFTCHQENLAQTANPILRGKNVGAVVDNSELGPLGRLSQTRLADFKSQLAEWLAAESRAVTGLTIEDIRTRQEHTIFVVSFGVWDIWSLISKDYGTAKESVERRIATIIAQLNVLAKSWDSESELKVILTQAVDVTFLPGYDESAAGSMYKDTVQTVEHWNKKLREAATAWEGGTVYLFDMNGWMVDRIRDWQLFAAGIEEENGLGKNQQGWENVVEPCVESGYRVMMSKGKQCEEPDRYLFWNEMHLGSEAHRLLATEVYSGIGGLLNASRHTRWFA